MLRLTFILVKICKLSSTDIGDQSEMQTANISMLVMKKRLSVTTGDGATYNAHGYGLSRWENGAGVSVELPDQESLTGDCNNTISLGFTSYTNLGNMMSDNKTGIIRSAANKFEEMMVM